VPRSRKPRGGAPKNVHVTTAKGRQYAWHQHGRGTASAGRRTKLPWPPWRPNGEPDERFWVAYRACEQVEAPAGPRPGSFDELVIAYLGSPEFLKSATSTRKDYERYANIIRDMWGNLMVSALKPKDVIALRDTMLKTPGAANGLVAVLSLLLSWSVPRGYRNDNPCEHVPKLRLGEGAEAWSWDAILFFRDNAVVQMWWVAALAVYTGQRQADVLKMMWTDIKDGTIKVVQQKSGRTRNTVWVPIHRDLQAVLDVMPRASTYMVTTRSGKQWTGDGFRSVWADQMECLSLLSGMCHGLVFHGFRKSAVCFLLESGCTTAEVSSITGQSIQMVEHYARMMNRGKLAASAMLKWESNPRREVSG
jgi:integrase